MNDDRLLQQLKAFGVWAASMRSLATFTYTLTLLRPDVMRAPLPSHRLRTSSSRYSFSVVRLHNNIININKPMEFEAFADRALLFVANLVYNNNNNNNIWSIKN